MMNCTCGHPGSGCTCWSPAEQTRNADRQAQAARIIELAIARAVARGVETIPEMAHQSAKALMDKGLLR